MKCPLLTAGMYADQTVTGDVAVECYEEECAWWDAEAKVCVLVAIHYRLATISGSLMGIEKKMPHLEQFKRA